MEKQLFRKSSIDKVSSPEQLNDYVRVANPGVWMILAAVIILLAGVCVWGVFGRLDTVIDTVASCEDGMLTLYIKESGIEQVKSGMQVNVNGSVYTVSEVSKTPVSVDGMDEYLLHKGGFHSGEWVYTAAAKAELPDGVYSAQIVVESVSPMSFVMN